MTNYKTYELHTSSNETRVYKEGAFIFGTAADVHTDSETKAKTRIDRGYLKAPKHVGPREAYDLMYN